MDSIKRIVLNGEMVCCHNGTTVIEIQKKVINVENDKDLIKFIETAGSLENAISKIKKVQKTIKPSLFDEYKVTITLEGKAKELKWPVVKRKSWIFCVETPVGLLWLGNNHLSYSNEHVEIDKTQLSDYLKWLNDWMDREENLYVPLIEVKNEAAHKAKTDLYRFEYMRNAWCVQTKKWLWVSISEKEAEVAKSEVAIINDHPAAPVWYMSHMIKGGGLESFMPIKMKFEFLNRLFE